MCAIELADRTSSVQLVRCQLGHSSIQTFKRKCSVGQIHRRRGSIGLILALDVCPVLPRLATLFINRGGSSRAFRSACLLCENPIFARAAHWDAGRNDTCPTAQDGKYLAQFAVDNPPHVPEWRGRRWSPFGVVQLDHLVERRVCCRPSAYCASKSIPIWCFDITDVACFSTVDESIRRPPTICTCDGTPCGVVEGT